MLGIGGPPGTAFVEIGRIARARADHLILTTSSFRAQPRIPSLADLLRGARSTDGGELEVILDRRRAITRAVTCARSGDVVLIPGRGAFTQMRTDPRGEPLAFDDREAARDALRDAAAPALRHGDQAAARASVPQSVTVRPRRLSTARRPSREV